MLLRRLIQSLLRNVTSFYFISFPFSSRFRSHFRDEFFVDRGTMAKSRVVFFIFMLSPKKVVSHLSFNTIGVKFVTLMCPFR